MKIDSELLKNITMVTQFGLSLLMPLLLCVLFCWWLTTRFGIGGWIFIPGFFFGLGSSGMTAWKLYKSVMNREEKERDSHPVAFNRHG